MWPHVGIAGAQLTHARGNLAFGEIQVPRIMHELQVIASYGPGTNLAALLREARVSQCLSDRVVAPGLLGMPSAGVVFRTEYVGGEDHTAWDACRGGSSILRA